MSAIDPKQLAQSIDHTLLNPFATREQIQTLCEQAREHAFCSVCIGPRWVSLAADLLVDSPVKVATVIGFPLGFETTRIKVQQAKDAIFDGADEIDMVADLAAIIEQDAGLLTHQLTSVLKICRHMRPAVTLKVIIESAALTQDQIVFACEICNLAQVDFVKTSTGFHAAGGATVEAVTLMKTYAPHCQVKASGGIRTLDQALAMLQAGATRLGTSASVDLMQAVTQGT